FHYTMFGGGGVMFFAALHFWLPKMFGRIYRKSVANLCFVLFFIGFNLLYFPLFIAGFEGMARRYADYLEKYTIYHRLSTVGSWIMVTGILIMFANLAWAVFKGKRAEQNPWGGATLEWEVASPPPTHQFEKVPRITRGPYDYTDEVKND
ncbi:MAG: cytochrome c oxidase subunit I, partial [Armatimonadia bacterium]|nr:cytochrome c oxidase subunit I [Armatimonadia bacterium]